MQPSLIKALPIVAAVYAERFGVPVHVGGSQACTDGRSVRLPLLPLGDPAALEQAAALLGPPFTGPAALPVRRFLEEALWGYLAHEAKDALIPATATVARKDGFAFEASAFASPAKATPVALEWRVGRIGKNGWYELADHWKGESKTDRVTTIPAEAFNEAGEYRVRARWRDATGRCGHWSAPVPVTVR